MNEGPFRAHRRGVPLFISEGIGKHVIAELFQLPGKIVYAEAFWPRDGVFRVVPGTVERGADGWQIGPCTIRRIGAEPDLLYVWQQWRAWRVAQDTDYNRERAWDAILERGVAYGPV